MSKHTLGYLLQLLVNALATLVACCQSIEEVCCGLNGFRNRINRCQQLFFSTSIDDSSRSPSLGIQSNFPLQWLTFGIALIHVISSCCFPSLNHHTYKSRPSSQGCTFFSTAPQKQCLAGQGTTRGTLFFVSYIFLAFQQDIYKQHP